MYDSGGSRFVRHGPCEACGSRDNVAWYENGSGFCFGCGRFYQGRLEKSSENLPCASNFGAREGMFRSPPDDIGSDFPLKVISWISKYDLKPEDLIRNNIKWSPSREQLIYIFYGRDEEVILWQARNFRNGTTHKDRFFTGGTPEDVIAVYPPGQTEGEIGVIVEDCISALKVGRAGFIGVPAFSSAISPRKLARLAKRFDRIVWWLDGDKYKEAQKQTQRTALLGVSTNLIYTALDPKEYSDEAIRRYVLNENVK